MDISELRQNQIKPKLPEGKEFFVWLTHDVDRTDKTIFHSLYYFLKEGRLNHLQSLFPGRNPYWNFQHIMDLESKHNARSTFFFLSESVKADFKNPKSFVLAWGRYNIDSPQIKSVIREIDSAGWEVGVHGSYNSYNDKELLLSEKNKLENILGHEACSVRQHYWNNLIPDTWQLQKQVGFRFDATIVNKNNVGFCENVYYPFKPFGDDFIVIPTVVMDAYLADKAKGNLARGKGLIDEIIALCSQKKTVMNVLWHQRFLNRQEFPLLYDLYVYILEAAVASKGEFILPYNRICERTLAEHIE